MSCPEAPCVCVYAGVCPVTKRRHDLVEIISAGPRAEKNALAARDRLVNQVEERRNPRTNATVGQLPDGFTRCSPHPTRATRASVDKGFESSRAPMADARSSPDEARDLLDQRDCLVVRVDLLQRPQPDREPAIGHEKDRADGWEVAH
jgi:hypothetical protein